MIFECNTDKMIIGDTIFFIISSFFFRLEKHTEYRSVAQYFENRGTWGKVQGCAPLPLPPSPPPPEMTCGFLIELVLVFCKNKAMWFIGVEVEQETSAPPPKKWQVLLSNQVRSCTHVIFVIKSRSFSLHQDQQSMPLQELLILDSK